MSSLALDSYNDLEAYVGPQETIHRAIPHDYHTRVIDRKRKTIVIKLEDASDLNTPTAVSKVDTKHVTLKKFINVSLATYSVVGILGFISTTIFALSLQIIPTYISFFILLGCLSMVVTLHLEKKRSKLY